MQFIVDAYGYFVKAQIDKVFDSIDLIDYKVFGLFVMILFIYDRN